MNEYRESLQQMEEIVNSARMGIWTIELFDGKQPRMLASDMMLELIGIDRADCLTPEQIYEAWFSGICPESMDSVNKSVQKMQSGKNDENTYRWMHPQLGSRYVRCGGTGHYVEGKGHLLRGYHYDVTEQILQKQERTIIIDSLAKTYMCLYYIDLKTSTYSAYYNGMKSVEAVIPIRGDLATSFANFAKYLVKPEYAKAIRSFTDLTTLNERLKKKDRISQQFLGVDDIWSEVIIYVCDRNEDNSAKHLVMGVRNINEQKKIEAQHIAEIKKSIEIDKHKTEYLQNMTHEIRTPLNAMFGFGQLLAMPDGTLTQSEKDDFLNHIFNSYNMLTMLIDDVLDLANATHGNYRTVIETVNVNESCRNAIKMSSLRKMESVNMYFTTEVSDSYTIKSDSRRIQQLLVNYLSNACKHTIKGEIRLHCSTTENPGHLTFSVTDTGEGVPAEMAEGIFERFKKLNQNVQGSGIGLNICRIISEKLNGKVLLDTSYTGGARFLFIL